MVISSSFLRGIVPKIVAPKGVFMLNLVLMMSWAFLLRLLCKNSFPADGESGH